MRFERKQSHNALDVKSTVSVPLINSMLPFLHSKQRALAVYFLVTIGSTLQCLVVSETSHITLDTIILHFHCTSTLN